MNRLRLAQAQVNFTVGDLGGNSKQIADAIARAAELGVDVITFPELAICGYPPEDLLLRPAFLKDCRAQIEKLAGSCQAITALVGFPEVESGTLYNSAAILSGGCLQSVYRKTELPNYGVFDEKRYFAPGEEMLTLERCGARLGVTVCEDIWISGGRVADRTREAGAALVLNLSASPFHAGKLGARLEAVRSFAKASAAYVAYNNLVGGQDELVFDGGALVVSPDGEVLAAAKRFEAALLVTDFEVGPGGALSAGRGECAPELGELEEIRAALVLATRDYASKNGFEGVTLGLSGGIDSAVTAAIAVEALGAEHVTGVTMPSEFTSGETRSDAEQLAGNLGIEFLTVPIKSMHHAYLEALSDQLGEDPGVAGENIQARVRGNILMALSNKKLWLVLTTGNKSESAVGYCTLYGDTAGGFAVIKDVFKTVVFELARHINATAGREIIPESTITRPPTAELKANQKDEDSLPPYDLLDGILKPYVEEDRSAADIAAMGFDPELVAKVIRMVEGAEFKRRQVPPGVKITPKAFGRDRRLPITNKYR